MIPNQCPANPDCVHHMAMAQLANDGNWCDRNQIEQLKAQLAQVTAERDRLIERWPLGNELGVVRQDIGGIAGVIGEIAPKPGDRSMPHFGWFYRGVRDNGSLGPIGPYPTREAAVRAAAGLDTGSDCTTDQESGK